MQEPDGNRNQQKHHTGARRRRPSERNACQKPRHRPADDVATLLHEHAHRAQPAGTGIGLCRFHRISAHHRTRHHHERVDHQADEEQRATAVRRHNNGQPRNHREGRGGEDIASAPASEQRKSVR